jgi:hypothetical protein
MVYCGPFEDALPDFKLLASRPQVLSEPPDTEEKITPKASCRSENAFAPAVCHKLLGLTVVPMIRKITLEERGLIVGRRLVLGALKNLHGRVIKGLPDGSEIVGRGNDVIVEKGQNFVFGRPRPRISGRAHSKIRAVCDKPVADPARHDNRVVRRRSVVNEYQLVIAIKLGRQSGQEAQKRGPHFIEGDDCRNRRHSHLIEFGNIGKEACDFKQTNGSDTSSRRA